MPITPLPCRRAKSNRTGGQYHERDSNCTKQDPQADQCAGPQDRGGRVCQPPDRSDPDAELYEEQQRPAHWPHDPVRQDPRRPQPPAGSLHDAADQILQPGEQAVYFKSDNDLKILTIRPENTISWVTGVFEFKDNSLEDIMQELQRAFHVKIHIENENLKRQTFNANFTEKETLEEILSVLQISARYKIEKRKGEIFLK